MQTQDLIFIDVVGTNGSTRQQRAILHRFNGAGQPIDDKGNSVGGNALPGSFPIGGGAPVPPFPTADYNKLAAANDADGVKTLLKSYQQQVEAASIGSGSGSEEVQLVDRIMGFLSKYEGVQEQDGNHFVLNRKDLSVTVLPLHDGRKLYKVTGAAVFGA